MEICDARLSRGSRIRILDVWSSSRLFSIKGDRTERMARVSSRELIKALWNLVFGKLKLKQRRWIRAWIYSFQRVRRDFPAIEVLSTQVFVNIPGTGGRLEAFPKLPLSLVLCFSSVEETFWMWVYVLRGDYIQFRTSFIPPFLPSLCLWVRTSKKSFHPWIAISKAMFLELVPASHHQPQLFSSHRDPPPPFKASLAGGW